MKTLAIALATTLLATGLAGPLAAPAKASLASDTFKDVPDGYWAQDAVAEVAIKYGLMTGYPDGTFRGTQPFTRYQFAESLRALLDELETLSKISWRKPSTGRYTFTDVPANDPERGTILSLANDYGLFEGVPGITPTDFDGQHVVTRDEMAQVINNLMGLGEADGVVRAPGHPPFADHFKDVTHADWAWKAILLDDARYHVMVGFPDGTFRGPEQLTRYQYAAAVAQTFPLITALVKKTLAENAANQQELAYARRFQEASPGAIDLQSGSSTGAATNGFVTALGGRYVAYPGNAFFMSRTRLLLNPGNLVSVGAPAANMGETLGLLADEQLSGFWALPLLGSVQLQPYVGVRAIGDLAQVAGGSLFDGAAGPAIGLLGYWRANEHWGLYADGGAADMLLESNAAAGSGPLLTGAEGGVEYHFTPELGLTLGLSYWQVPSSLRATTPGSGKASVLGGDLGLEF